MIIDPANQSFSENHKLMIGSIVPRPIALVSTISKGNINNVAPFSYFNGVCSNPPTIMFAPARRGYDGKTKDTLNNIRETNEFAINIVSEEIVEPMVACSTESASACSGTELCAGDPSLRSSTVGNKSLLPP